MTPDQRASVLPAAPHAGAKETPAWTLQDAADLYGVDAWGAGYVAVTPRGTIEVRPTQDPGDAIDLDEVIEGLAERGFTTPVLLRFPDLLRHRLQTIRDAFDTAIADNEYKNGYRGIYPIKVNQSAHLAEAMRTFGKEVGFGLEAGSKPELLAVLGLTAQRGYEQTVVVCNGYKDEEYLETAVLATKLGREVVPVIERFRELEHLIAAAEKHGVRPRIGVRCKPSSRGQGRWGASTGERSKFGLSATEMLALVERLKRHDLLDCLNLLHFHIGSQVPDIRRLKDAVSELARVYVELVRLGAPMGRIDVGGGMGVDYIGSGSARDGSMNYSVAEYASDVVHRIKTVCDEADVPHPEILTESGRAMVAHSSILVFDVFGRTRFTTDPDMASVRALIEDPEDNTPQPVADLADAFERLPKTDDADDPAAYLVEIWHDAEGARDDAENLFGYGHLSLTARGAVERLHAAIGRGVMAAAQRLEIEREEFDALPDRFSDLYYANLSIFQSIPDSWAIDQLFPVCPIHRLSERPTRLGTFADLTCDSDGKLDHFPNPDGGPTRRALPMHEVREGEPYRLAVFMVGAYQEVLGDLHNLFGDTHAVHVHLDDESGWAIEDVVNGDTVREVLEYLQYDVADLREAVRREVERAIRKNVLTPRDGQDFLRHYDAGLDGYTYLEDHSR